MSGLKTRKLNVVKKLFKYGTEEKTKKISFYVEYCRIRKGLAIGDMIIQPKRKKVIRQTEPRTVKYLLY